jgi:hypothetical protein
MADGERAIRIASADSSGGLRYGHCTSHALVCDTGIGAFEVVPNAYMTNHVVRQDPQQPHWVDSLAQILPEPFHVITRRGEQREEIIVTTVVAPAGTREDTATVVKLGDLFRGEGLPVASETRVLNGEACGV